MPTMRTSPLGECRFDSPQADTVSDDLFVPAEIQWPGGQPPKELTLLEVAGPRKKLFFDPQKTRAAVVTCGGLCPGLNNVIRSLFNELYYGYGVREILGFRDGYRGLDPNRARPPVKFTPEIVDGIHRTGGTILSTSRGPVDIKIAVDELIRLGVDILFCIGGDGTLRGSKALLDEASNRSHRLAVVGIPKTIDNDVPLVTRTFGFTTAVDESRRVIECAHVEARSVFNGVSLVKLMGRHAGFIAAAATVSSQDVNFCLIPEQPFKLEGEHGLFAVLERRLAARQHAVVVVAEGAGQSLMQAADDGTRDASGNVKLQDIGTFLRSKLEAHFKQQKIEMTMRYFDPSYQIRSQPANTEDAVLCDRFARHAVHARDGRTIGDDHLVPERAVRSRTVKPVVRFVQVGRSARRAVARGARRHGTTARACLKNRARKSERTASHARFTAPGGTCSSVSIAGP